MIRLSGRTPHEEIAITYIGLRPGEKLYEELFHEQENLLPTAHEKILLGGSTEVATLWVGLDPYSVRQPGEPSVRAGVESIPLGDSLERLSSAAHSFGGLPAPSMRRNTV